eukprot:5558708-Prymnesium_polylepis.1
MEAGHRTAYESISFVRVDQPKLPDGGEPSSPFVWVGLVCVVGCAFSLLVWKRSRNRVRQDALLRVQAQRALSESEMHIEGFDLDRSDKSGEKENGVW